jgi:hypothetical protein
VSNGSNGVNVERHLRYTLDQIAKWDVNCHDGLERYFRHVILLKSKDVSIF